MKNWTTVIFGLIIAIAIALRFWQLGNVPPSPNWDEVALGYDAYSIGLTGKDEYGTFLPVVLRSFDDYKPALYAYLAIPFVFILGLNTIAVRLPSAIFGVIAVIATYFLVRTLFENYKFKDSLSLVASFLMAISPWSIQFSRVGFESNVGSALNIIAALLFLKGLKKPILLSGSAVCAALSIYVYQSEKVFTPLLILILVVINAKRLFSIQKKYLITAFIVGTIIIIPMVVNILTDESTLLRARGTSIFSKQTEILETHIKRLESDRVNGDLFGVLLDNRRVVYANAIVGGYLSHYDLNWLFIRGDIGRHHAPGMGLLYLFELPLILAGIYLLVFGRFDIRTKLTFFLWFLAVPIPASITTEVPHAVRTLNFLPIWQIFAALGAIHLFYFWKSRFLRLKTKDLRRYILLLGLTSYVLFTVANFVYYLNQYFVQLNYYTSNEWQYGYKQAVEEVVKLQDKYQKIVVSDEQPLDKSYMFFLFYLKYPPNEYQKIGALSSGGFRAHHSFGKFEFRPINWQKDSTTQNILYVGRPDNFPSGGSVIKTINNLDGSVAIQIVGT